MLKQDDSGGRLTVRVNGREGHCFRKTRFRLAGFLVPYREFGNGVNCKILEFEGTAFTPCLVIFSILHLQSLETVILSAAGSIASD